MWEETVELSVQHRHVHSTHGGWSMETMPSMQKLKVKWFFFSQDFKGSERILKGCKPFTPHCPFFSWRLCLEKVLEIGKQGSEAADSHFGTKG